MELRIFRDPVSCGSSDASNASISKISHFVEKEVVLRGWAYNIRGSGKVAFLELRDGSGIIQCVGGPQDLGAEKFEALRAIERESALVVKGVVKEDKRSKIGFEILLSDFVSVPGSQEFPIGKKEHGVAFLMDHRHLWLRSSKQMALLRVRAELVAAIRSYFDDRGFYLVDSPILTPNACEGTTTLFETPYFESTAYLTQSGQLYAEASAMALSKVYCFGPTFRAEKSKTRRHLAEFWMVEPEVAFMDLNGDMELAEDFVSAIVQRCVEKCESDLQVLERDVEALRKIQKPFPRVTYEEALQILEKHGKKIPFGEDFGAEEETLISKEFDRPVIIHRYPMKIKAFYMKQDPEDSRLALCMDMIAPEGVGEIIGGGQREDDLSLLEARIREHQLPEEAFRWYLDLRRFGSVPHAGFGLGLERTLGWITGVPHVRECIPYPRMMDKIFP